VKVEEEVWRWQEDCRGGRRSDTGGGNSPTVPPLGQLVILLLIPSFESIEEVYASVYFLLRDPKRERKRERDL